MTFEQFTILPVREKVEALSRLLKGDIKFSNKDLFGSIFNNNSF